MLRIQRILAPVDFSERSRGAARYAEALAEHFGAEIVALHVLPPPYPEFASMDVALPVADETHARRRAHVERLLGEFAQQHWPGAKVTRVLLEGDPAARIVQYAHEHAVDLIVMATHGHGPFRRFILGSVTAKVLHDADCPVWTGVHLEDAPVPEQVAFRRVLAAVDLGPSTSRVLQWAYGFATHYRAELAALHVTISLEGRTGEYFDPDWREHLGAEVRQQLRHWVEQTGIGAELLVDFGEVPKRVAAQAAERGADLVVIGRSSAAGVLGRVRANAYAIIRESPCPVVSV